MGLGLTKEQLSGAYTNADAARQMHSRLNRMKVIAHEGYYDNLSGKWFAEHPGWETSGVQLGFDQKKLANTFEFQRLANELVIAAQDNKGLRVGQTEVDQLKGASGGLEKIPSKATALQMIDGLRKKFDEHIDYYNGKAQEQRQKGISIDLIDRNTRVMSRDEFTRRYDAVKAQNPTITKDALALQFERGDPARGIAPIRVEGAY